MELDNDKYSKNNKKYIILLSYFLCILGFIMIVIGTIFGLKNPYYDSDKYNKIIYAGYKFYIPKSCTTTT